jgi:Zn-dependent protease/CBS domain-containing protein
VNHGVRVGRIGGVDIVADVSLLVVAAAVVWIVYVDVGVAYPATESTIATIIAFVAGAGVVGSVLAHEGSHAIVAQRRGMHVRRIQLLAFGGYTTIDGKAERPRDELAVSAAGPTVSFLLAGVLWLLAAAASAFPEARSAADFLAFTNLFVALFNLLPGFPLDGGRVLRAVAWRATGDRVRATAMAIQAGRVFGWLVIGVAFVITLATLNPWALFGALLGWYLLRSAEIAGRRELLITKVDGLVAADAMRETPDPVPGDMFVADVVDLYQIGARLRSLPVEVDGRIRGVLGEPEIERLSPARRVSSRASAVMTKIGPGDVIDARTPLDTLMQHPGGRRGRLVVVSDGRVVGMIEAADLGRVVERV